MPVAPSLASAIAWDLIWKSTINNQHKDWRGFLGKYTIHILSSINVCNNMESFIAVVNKII